MALSFDDNLLLTHIYLSKGFVALRLKGCVSGLSEGTALQIRTATMAV